MEKLKVNNQKSTAKFWLDETGNKVPTSRLYKHEKIAEKNNSKMLKEALKINKALAELKEMAFKMCEEWLEQYIIDKELEQYGTKGKGNATIYNFDRSIKVDIAISDQIKFEPKGIETCKQLLDKYLAENIESKKEFVKEIVKDAFSTTRGKLDTKKVMRLLSYRKLEPAEIFQKALDELEQSIRRPSSKSYFRIYALDEHGEYQNIDLNFSSIKHS